MSEYTPSTTEILTAWLYSETDTSDGDDERQELAAEFDRWLASVRAEAWDEGQDAYGSMNNPYQEEPK